MKGPAATPGPASPAVESLAAGTRWAMDLHRIEGPAPGPTLLVVAGLHGNEPAGPAAATEILGWRLVRGTLFVVPHANRPALAAARRLAPATAHRDLNRNFPTARGERPRGQAATVLWELVRRLRPDWLLDLHEGLDVHRSNPRSVGRSILGRLVPGREPYVRRMLVAVDALVAEPSGRFVRLRRAARGSLVRAAAEQLGIAALMLETARGGEPLSARTAQHLCMIEQLLVDLEMRPPAPPRLTAATTCC